MNVKDKLVTLEILQQIKKNILSQINNSGFVKKSVSDLTNYYTKTEVDNRISKIPKFSIKVVEGDSLPTTSISPTTIYILKSKDSSEDNNLYDEYIYVDGQWEKIGSQKSIVPTKLSQLINDGNYVVDENYQHTDNNYTSEDKEKLSKLTDTKYDLATTESDGLMSSIDKQKIDNLSKKNGILFIGEYEYDGSKNITIPVYDGTGELIIEESEDVTTPSFDGTEE